MCSITPEIFSIPGLQEEDADFVRQKKRCQEFLNLLGQSQPHAIFANVLSMWPLA